VIGPLLALAGVLAAGLGVALYAFGKIAARTFATLAFAVTWALPGR
jgi:hypothetical protein